MSNLATKFALRNFAGKPTKFFRVEMEDLEGQAQVAKKSASHHALIIDRSGSMYNDLGDLKTMVEKLLTLGEFNDPSLKVSLISYSSQGDVKLHFSHVTVADVMKASSPYLQEIRSIRATAMTCISQGLAMAESIIDDKEVTCVTLHSDGFANDSSPSAESRSIQAVIEKFKKHPNVFVNTIAYRDWCDFGLLSGISNALSGVCIQAKSIKQVYEALHSATALLAGSMAPAVEVGIGQAQYLTFVSRKAGKVLGSSDNLTVRGLAATDDRIAYRYYEVDEAAYNKLSAPDTINSAFFAIPAYCRAQISEGRLNQAKYALVAMKNDALLNTHYRALVSSDVAAFAAAVEGVIANGLSLDTNYGLSVKGPSVLQVLSVLDKHAGSLSVNLKVLIAGYKRRGLKKVAGTRLDDGTLQAPTIESRNREKDAEWVSVNKFEINRNTATINMLVSQPIDLFPQGGGTRIASVKGVNLDSLRSFNNYTLVGDGQLNVSALMFRTTDKRCFSGLKDIGAVTGAYEPNAAFAVDFSSLPLVDFEQKFDSVAPTEIKDLARLTVLSKILTGMSKGGSVSLTSEQIVELKTHYLSPALNFSPPTTNEYTVLEDAISQGKVDTRLSYKIDVGIPALTSVTKLKSGNEYLQRRFTLTFLDKAVDKPTLDQITLPKAKWEIKKLTARTQLDEVDNLSYPIYEGFLGLGSTIDIPVATTSTDEVYRILKLAGCIDPAVFFKTMRSGDQEKALVAVSDALEYIDRTIESFYDRVRPLAFYVGATGLVPDSLDAKALNAEQLSTQFPDAKLSKAEKDDGTFFVLPNGLVLTIYVKGEYFTTGQAA
jgi:Mg-chelatase subunit ChlD